LIKNPIFLAPLPYAVITFWPHLGRAGGEECGSQRFTPHPEEDNIMTRTLTMTATLALTAGLLTGNAAMAQTTVATPTGPTQEISTPPAPGTAEHDAQLKREHDRAVAAGDHANDPYNSASSDALNQQQAAKAAELGNAPVPVDLGVKLAPATEPSSEPAQVPHPNITDPSGNTAGTLPADPDPTQIKPVESAQPPIL
jgi:hypothetical protein